MSKIQRMSMASDYIGSDGDQEPVKKTISKKNIVNVNQQPEASFKEFDEVKNQEAIEKAKNEKNKKIITYVLIGGVVLVVGYLLLFNKKTKVI